MNPTITFAVGAFIGAFLGVIVTARCFYQRQKYEFREHKQNNNTEK